MHTYSFCVSDTSAQFSGISTYVRYCLASNFGVCSLSVIWTIDWRLTLLEGQYRISGRFWSLQIRCGPWKIGWIYLIKSYLKVIGGFPIKKGTQISLLITYSLDIFIVYRILFLLEIHLRGEKHIHFFRYCKNLRVEHSQSLIADAPLRELTL